MSADFVFINGQVITVDQRNTVVEAVAVKGNRILAAGSTANIKTFIGPHTEVIDLNGRSLLPGFIDAHLHLTLHGTNQLAVSCKDPHIESIGDLLTALKQKAAQTPPGQWVRAWGFNNTKIKEKRYPTRWELDQISTEHPIMIIRTCGHISAVNSKALEIAGINEHTPDPDGGKIERDASGIPTGVLVETAHMAMFEKAQYTEAELRQGMKLASDAFIAAGITSVHDAGGYGPENMRVLQQAIQDGDVKVRVYAMICSLNNSDLFVQRMIDAGILTGCGDERFKIGPAKVFIDGSSSGPTIATREGYTSDPDNYGILYYSQEELNEILGTAHEKGYQITAHAQGDRAIEMLLNCIEQALKKHLRTNHRHRIEHAGVSTPDLIQRMKKLNVVPIPNPPFIYEYGDGYITNYGARVNHMFPARDFIDQGIIAAGSSDCPVTDYNPLMGIFSAVNRVTQSGVKAGENQAVSVMEAIRMYTWNGAYASFDEHIKGSIEPGKLADLVVLHQPILDVPPEEIKDVGVDMTMVDGEIVYHAD
ncbi:putative amidohydrolase YtcJ [Caldalkalibacillus uzonensis]|uniref:Amidohydrolase YtcJ n=1 Tax=Caldalkalibacillus uzonensis TaxID=353224 RepID=A0ABU0CS53_9BACI|nr:amidohydrolase [Caldalkalibacillus uzonensis]MDQ0338689.1 putative amidohydrolase YtcJ [Caldalkalibacillus uzonensis]